MATTRIDRIADPQAILLGTPNFDIIEKTHTAKSSARKATAWLALILGAIENETAEVDVLMISEVVPDV